MNNYLKHGLIVDTRSRLQRERAAIAEGPSSADSEAVPRSLLQDGGHHRFLIRCPRGGHHHPVGIEAIKIELPAIEDKLISLCLHKTSSNTCSNIAAYVYN